VDFAKKNRWALAVATWVITTTFALAGEGDILKQVVNPALAAQRAALANQAQTAQAVQALRSATQTFQANGIRGGGLMINVSSNPNAVPSQVIGSIHAGGKIYVIDRKRHHFWRAPPDQYS